MKVLITDVTRMEGEKVCIAGLHRQTTMRLAQPSPYRAHLERIGGLLPGDMLDIAWRKERRTVRPHTEDGHWAIEEKLARVRYIDFVHHLGKSAVYDVSDAFGPVCVTSNEGNLGFEPGKGLRSLATLKCEGCEVYRDQGGKVRISFQPAGSGATVTGVPLNDLAFGRHMGGCEQCEGGAEFGECMLRIGVGRAFAPRDHEEASCWLQVNAIYPIEDEWPHFYREPAALALTG